jgi:hypothetical protein
MKNRGSTVPSKIRVEVTATIQQVFLRHQLPSYIPDWGKRPFSFDPEGRDYDWLVVYDDQPSKEGVDPTACISGRGQRYASRQSRHLLTLPTTHPYTTAPSVH